MDFLGLAKDIINGLSISEQQALELIKTTDQDTFELIAGANKIRQAKKGNKIKLCAIVNAKSGKCSENCSFCGQSAHHQTTVAAYPLLDSQSIVQAARSAEKDLKASCFSVVTSGRSIDRKEEVLVMEEAIKDISHSTRLNRCASIGCVSKETLQKLKQAGLSSFHHNLETSRSHFNKICSTHSYEERVATIKNAKEAGLKVCSGGIFNVGETLEQRVELAMTLKELEVDSVPINILHPIAGTPAAANHHPISPLEVLRIIATYRFILADKDIGVFGGREKALGHLQPLMFTAGANVTLIGDYLTTQGAPPQKDLEMIEQMGLEVYHA